MNADKVKGFDLDSAKGLKLYRRQSAFIGGSKTF